MQPLSPSKGTHAQLKRAVREGVKYPWMKYDPQFSQREKLAIHEGVVHDRIQSGWKEKGNTQI